VNRRRGILPESMPIATLKKTWLSIGVYALIKVCWRTALRVHLQHLMMMMMNNAAAAGTGVCVRYWPESSNYLYNIMTPSSPTSMTQQCI